MPHPGERRNGANASGFRLHHARVVCATAVDRRVKDSAAVKGSENGAIITLFLIKKKNRNCRLKIQFSSYYAFLKKCAPLV